MGGCVLGEANLISQQFECFSRKCNNVFRCSSTIFLLWLSLAQSGGVQYYVSFFNASYRVMVNIDLIIS
jgi:hypothetical protein